MYILTSKFAIWDNPVEKNTPIFKQLSVAHPILSIHIHSVSLVLLLSTEKGYELIFPLQFSTFSPQLVAFFPTLVTFFPLSLFRV